ncbi:MAG: gas vesicle protein K [Chloroflexi bacterium]|nr:gas vesicle protein K [Chloroflexota bacterium]
MSTLDLDRQVGEKLLYDPGDLDAFTTELERAGDALPRHINADPEGVEHGLAKLVLTLIELLRQLMERQALRRVEAGSLSDEEIERLGQTFMKLEARMDELRQVFGLEEEDLNLNLGPLGDLM